MARYFKACTIWLVVNFPTLWDCILTLGKCNHFYFEIIDFQLQNEHLELHLEETGNQCSSWSRDVTLLGPHNLRVLLRFAPAEFLDALQGQCEVCYSSPNVGIVLCARVRDDMPLRRRSVQHH